MKPFYNSYTPLSDRDRLKTPLWLYRMLDNGYKFDIDLAAEDDRLHANYITRKQNALNRYWPDCGKIGFLNPPYSDIAPWVNHAVHYARQGTFTTVMLIPTPNGELYYHKCLREAAKIIFITGRINFMLPNGVTVTKGNNRGSCVFVFKEHVQQEFEVILRDYCWPLTIQFEKDETWRSRMIAELTPSQRKRFNVTSK